MPRRRVTDPNLLVVDPIYTIAAAAEFLGVSRRTLYRMKPRMCRRGRAGVGIRLSTLNTMAGRGTLADGRRILPRNPQLLPLVGPSGILPERAEQAARRLQAEDPTDGSSSEARRHATVSSEG